jgi:hypothetical protein
MRLCEISDGLYVAGLRWLPIDTFDDALDRLDDQDGTELRAVLIPNRKQPRSLGVWDGEPGVSLVSIAGLVALSHADPVIAIEQATVAGRSFFWLGAVIGGRISADFLYETATEVEGEIASLQMDSTYQICGSASAGFGGNGERSFEVTRAHSARASIGKLSRPGSYGQYIFLAGLICAVIALAWSMLAEDELAAPREDAAKLRAEAIASRNAALSAALSGFNALDFGRWALQSTQAVAHSQRFWHFDSMSCWSADSRCAVTWTAEGRGAVPADLAADLGVPRTSIEHDLAALTATVRLPLQGSPVAVVATETTLLNGQVSTLVDLCKRFIAYGGQCSLAAAQPVTLPNPQSLPPGLNYHAGSISLTGPIGSMASLLPLFGHEVEPWARPSTFKFSTQDRQFNMEMRYVIP